jgi:hypothetical protein
LKAICIVNGSQNLVGLLPIFFTINRRILGSASKTGVWRTGIILQQDIFVIRRLKSGVMNKDMICGMLNDENRETKKRQPGN